MATLPPLPNPLTASADTSAAVSATSFTKSSQLLLISRVKKSHFCKSFSTRVSCSSGGNESESMYDWRGMFIGLGGLYGLTGMGNESPIASASPILAPDITTCGTLELPLNARAINCCPPPSTTVVDFKFGPSNAPLRFRPAAHLADKAYTAKYTKALELMKALPDSDPRSFTQQSNVHCAYGGYTQVGFPDLDLQVHGSRLFLPFHRYYLYFFERILGFLIGIGMHRPGCQSRPCLMTLSQYLVKLYETRSTSRPAWWILIITGGKTERRTNNKFRLI